ncbi:hypothetical protein [Hymenobacter sp. BRD67]|uniref:hypothetical protein n=1 Tax=Hymenobacter sp. BRD67 TaxID=2675877 RepID=UPI001567391D|nr:hypothetical protein [Hymenobacter sp. BRD67]QKG55085.1 hypothetical protein GKZ67_21935 [Hymenobacter sp. BRD67]QKG55152.1 hypothetical protein GKZ67_22295 [Hymenobacter sp. BRD67]
MVSSSPLPVVGLDVSKATLAVCYHVDHQVRHLEVRNDKAGLPNCSTHAARSVSS